VSSSELDHYFSFLSLSLSLNQDKVSRKKKDRVS
jgi:hypothetical protein